MNWQRPHQRPAKHTTMCRTIETPEKRFTSHRINVTRVYLEGRLAELRWRREARQEGEDGARRGFVQLAARSTDCSLLLLPDLSRGRTGTVPRANSNPSRQSHDIFLYELKCNSDYLIDCWFHRSYHDAMRWCLSWMIYTHWIGKFSTY